MKKRFYLENFDFLSGVQLISVSQEITICIFRLIGRRIMTEEYLRELFNELLKRNQKNANAISSFLKDASRRYSRKMNAQIFHSQLKVKHNQTPLIINKHLPTMRPFENKQNSLQKSDQIKQNQFHQSHNLFFSKQRKQQIKNLFQFVRETMETKLKFYNTFKKKNENVLESKPISRTLLHLKDIVFVGESIHKLEIRRNKSLKGSIKILPALKTEKSHNYLHQLAQKCLS